MLKDESKESLRQNETRNDEDRQVDWRELDRRKDRSAHRAPERDQGDERSRNFRTDYQLERYKKQLDEFFKGGNKPTPDQEKQLKKIREARGAEIDKQCLAYIEKFGTPKDWDSLTLFLDGTSPIFLKPILEAMDKLYSDQPPARQTTFKQRLRLLNTAVSDKPTRDQITGMLSKLA